MRTCPDCDGDGQFDNPCRRHPHQNCDCEVRPAHRSCGTCAGRGVVTQEQLDTITADRTPVAIATMRGTPLSSTTVIDVAAIARSVAPQEQFA